MNKQEAQKSLALGKSIKHTTFGGGEFIKFDNSNNLIDESNIILGADFWDLRKSEEFDDGWSIHNDVEFLIIDCGDMVVRKMYHSGNMRSRDLTFMLDHFLPSPHPHYLNKLRAIIYALEVSNGIILNTPMVDEITQSVTPDWAVKSSDGKTYCLLNDKQLIGKSSLYVNHGSYDQHIFYGSRSEMFDFLINSWLPKMGVNLTYRKDPHYLDTELQVGVITGTRAQYLDWLKSVGNLKYFDINVKFTPISCDNDARGYHFDAIEKAGDWDKAEISHSVIRTLIPMLSKTK